MGIFRKDPREKFLSWRSERRTYLILNSEYYGLCGMIALPSASSFMFENYTHQDGKYYLLGDGKSQVWGVSSFDEILMSEVSEWALILNSTQINGMPDTAIYFRGVMVPYTFAIYGEDGTKAINWFEKYYINEFKPEGLSEF